MNIKKQKFDAIIVGTGQSGPSFTADLAKSGMKVAIIEKHKFGGTCVNNGCMPTKTLVASARAAYVAKRSAEYGVNISGDITIDMKQVKARKDKVSNTANMNVENWLKNTENLTVFEGQGRFINNTTIRVGMDELTADKIFINVGTQPFIPPFPEIDDVSYFTNESIMDVDFLPRHLIIIGGSYIGLEFAQMYNRFGSKVTVIERSDRLIGREDDDVSDLVKEILEIEGVQIELDANDISPKQVDGEIVVEFKRKDESQQVKGSHLLIAVGRTPNTQDLGIENTDLELDQRGYINVDDECKTNVSGIWALGDCNGKGAFTHTSYNDYEIVVNNLLNNDDRRISDRVMTYGLFIDPPLGRVGMTEKQALESGRKVLIGKRMMSRVGRAIEKGETTGFMKVLIDADTEEVLGAAILGLAGDESIHSITSIMYAQASYKVLKRSVLIHPTVSELIPTMLGELKPLN